MKERGAQISRKTKETEIKLTLNIDGTGVYSIATGIGFMDHMLELFSKHSHIDLTIQAQGDTGVDDHHTAEDVGICLGEAFSKALGDKRGIRRFGFASVPMDEALANVSVDLSGRAFLVYNVPMRREKIGTFDTELVKESLQAFCFNAGFNLHINVPYTGNAHHTCEAIFKALARALREATRIEKDAKDIPSTKGIL